MNDHTDQPEDSDENDSETVPHVKAVADDGVVAESEGVPLGQIDTEQIEVMDHQFEECIAVIGASFGVHADVLGLRAEISRKHEGPLQVSEIGDLVQKLRLKAEYSKMGVRQIARLEAPCIMIMNEGLPRVFFPTRDQEGRIYKPGEGGGEEGFTGEKLSDLKGDFSGRIVIISPRHGGSAMDTSQLGRGHAVDWFWKPIVSYWPNYTEIILCTLFINLFVIALPLYTLNVYDRVIPNFSESTLYALTTGISIALVFDWMFKVTRALILQHIAARIGPQYDFELMERFMLMDPNMMNISVGEKTSLFHQMQGLKDFYAVQIAPMFVDLPFFFLFMGVIFMINPALVIVPIVGAILMFTVNMTAQIPINRATERYFSAVQNKSSLMVETLAGAQTFRMFNAVGNRLYRWNLSSTRVAERSRQTNTVLQTVQGLSQLIMHGVHIFVVFLGVYQIQNGDLTVGGLIACSIISGRSMGPIVGFSGILGRLAEMRDILSMIDKIYQVPFEGERSTHKDPKGPYKGQVVLRNISFTYPAQKRPALYGINLNINAGDRMAFIGRSGAGKSTLSKVIGGLLEPQAGGVFLDDYAYDVIPSTELRRTIGFVPQDPFFVAGTIKENILLGREDISPERFEKAVQRSGLERIMQQTGYGVDKEVGEDGGMLSGGQKQAVALARALVRDYKVLILDEPVSGIDKGIEEFVKRGLNEYLKDRTFIMITHRTSLLSLVNRLVMLDMGRVIADGPRDDVLRHISKLNKQADEQAGR